MNATDPVGVGSQLPVAAQIEPTQLLFSKAEYQVFQNAVTMVIVSLAMEIDGPARMGDFGDQFRCSFHIIIESLPIHTIGHN